MPNRSIAMNTTKFLVITELIFKLRIYRQLKTTTTTHIYYIMPSNKCNEAGQRTGSDKGLFWIR